MDRKAFNHLARSLDVYSLVTLMCINIISRYRNIEQDLCLQLSIIEFVQFKLIVILRMLYTDKHQLDHDRSSFGADVKSAQYFLNSSRIK